MNKHTKEEQINVSLFCLGIQFAEAAWYELEQTGKPQYYKYDLKRRINNAKNQISAAIDKVQKFYSTEDVDKENSLLNYMHQATFYGMFLDEKRRHRILAYAERQVELMAREKEEHDAYQEKEKEQAT